VFIDGFISQLICTLITRMTTVPFYPVPLYLMPLGFFVEGLPELSIFHGLLGRRFPTALNPIMDPLGNALAHVL
jgi:hypothetical protein